MNVFFITGTSGSGKSTLTHLLNAKLSKAHFEIYDFDENGVPENADAVWRQRTTDEWLVKANENSKHKKSTIICGVSVPSEVLRSSVKIDLPIYFGFIKISDEVIKQRLKARGWNDQLIQDNIHWAHHLEAEVKQQEHHMIVENDLHVTPEQMADQFIKWIHSLIQQPMIVTSCDDVNELLTLLKHQLQTLLGSKLVGLYITGSLTYGDFDRGSSDIDFVAVLNQALSAEELNEIKVIHTHIGERYPEWAKRIEGSYITQDMLASTCPPKIGRPYINGEKFWESAPYGNEWILNLHMLRERGMTLVGPDPRKLVPPIDMQLVRQASLKDLHEEFEPTLHNAVDLHDSHLQAYIILTLCRILHRMRNDEIVSKRGASAWVKKVYGEPWSSLVERAECWQHGQEMNVVQETLEFIRFALQEAKKVD